MLTTGESIADIVFRLEWKSALAAHTQVQYAKKVNFWRDCFPDKLYQDLIGKAAHAVVQRRFAPGEFLPLPDEKKIFDIAPSQFGQKTHGKQLTARRGRFYPKGILAGIPNVFSENIEPFRVLEAEETHIRVDFNHPLAGKPILVGADILKIHPTKDERGGSCTDWTEILTREAGMQAGWQTESTDFFSNNPFERMDEKTDRLFYQLPRFVSHMDDCAKKTVMDVYGQYLKPGMGVLDLMASWESHLPADLSFSKVTGLGLNHSELSENPVLSNHLVHDLNKRPALPFGDDTYDAVVCTASVEYLTQPFKVFQEVCRVLKPEGVFALTFSNRWFPPKAISIWTRLHEFERMGLVTAYFLEAGGFDTIETFSSSGFPRPQTDPYYGQYVWSDPVYAVTGRKCRA
ncbi:MAG: hypothetical protein CSA25_01150 [Desulfobacter postgatei]|uniref:Methyltransferase type 11 domain-containing protein n=1 Tax=Desulfobacter postgatei TaxID=2293 RepID=A0A2G6MUG1_9BACT|nr:MAG: hypothetical protein CSA25_01150 [Desulfobacter postgatei]